MCESENQDGCQEPAEGEGCNQGKGQPNPYVYTDSDELWAGAYGFRGTRGVQFEVNGVPPKIISEPIPYMPGAKDCTVTLSGFDLESKGTGVKLDEMKVLVGKEGPGVDGHVRCFIHLSGAPSGAQAIKGSVLALVTYFG